LEQLGYDAQQVEDIVRYIRGTGTLRGAPFINHQTLTAKGFDDAVLQRLESALGTAFEISFAFNRWTLGDDFCRKLGFSDAQLNDVNFNMLTELGFTADQIRQANDYCSGTMTIEG